MQCIGTTGRVLESRMNRIAGSEVLLVEEGEQDAPPLLAAKRYLAVCRTHGKERVCRTRDEARAYLAKPWCWCYDCAVVMLEREG